MAAIPVLLHLIMRGVPKRIEFPALRFLQRKQKVNRRKFQLRHLILLLLRVGLFVLIGLALARPSIRFDGPSASGSGSLLSRFASQETPIAAAIVIDSSPRMDYQIANQIRLEKAKVEARWVLSQLPEQSQIAVLNGVRRSETFEVDLYSAAERIDRTASNPEGRSVGESVVAALRLLKSSELETKELYVFSDLTSPGWPREKIASVRSQAEGIGVYVVDVGGTETNNSGIVRLELSGEVLSSQSTLRIDAELTHSGQANQRVIELITVDSSNKPTPAGPSAEQPVSDQSEPKASDENKPNPEPPAEPLAAPTDPATPAPGAEAEGQRRASQIVEFPEGTQTERLNFLLPNLPVGLHQGIVRLTTSDAFAADDQMCFTVEVQPAWKVLLVAREPARNALFLREALDPTVFRKRGNSPFQTETADFESFRTMTDTHWDSFRAVILLDPPPQNPAIWKRLADYAAQGHGVGVFLGRNANPIRSFQTEAALELLGGKPLRQVRADDDSFSLAPDSLQVPTLSAFRDYSEPGDVPWSLQPIFRYWEMGEIAESVEVEIRYSDGRPAVLSHPIGQGVAVVVSTPVSDAPGDEEPWNLLPVGENNWIFVGLADGIGRTLVGAGNQRFNYFPGQTANLRFSEGPVPASCVLTLPNGQTTKLTPDAAKRQLRFGGTEQIGNYRLRSGRASRGENGFSVNYPRGELDLSRIEPKLLDEYFGEKGYRLAKDRSEIEIVVARGRVGSELFPLIMLCVCLLFATEYVFSNRFYR